MKAGARPAGAAGLQRPARSGTAIIVFAKAPVAGQVKTRLAPALGAEGAAALAGRMLAHALAAACAAGARTVELCTAPDGARHTAFDALRATHRALHHTAQGPGDLGERMARALGRALATHERALLLGTDAPALDAGHLARAEAALCAGHDAVLVPALDGGYVLVGLADAAALPTLFTGIAWSTAEVMPATRRRAQAAGLRVAELAPVADIDVPADLVHLPAGWLEDPPLGALNGGRM